MTTLTLVAHPNVLCLLAHTSEMNADGLETLSLVLECFFPCPFESRFSTGTHTEDLTKVR